MNTIIIIIVKLLNLAGRLKQNHQNLLEQWVPIAYLNFQERILTEAARIRRHLSKEQPVLTWTQLL